ncbi:hypothetical protein Tco_1297791, partial [Tanacetum coccineum]
LSKVEGCGGLRGSQLSWGDKEVTMQYLELKGGDIGASKLLGDIRVRSCCLTSRSIISTGSSTKLSLSSSQSSFIGMTRDSSDKHFFRLEMWKVLWTLLSSSGSFILHATGPIRSRILNGPMYQGLSFPRFPNRMTPL